MGILATPVKINGTVCRNCYDVDWARKAEAENTKKRDAEAAKKAKEATAPSSFDNQPVTTLDGSLKEASRAAATSAAADSAPVAPPPTDTPGQSVNIFA
jgi:hypothetical protein